MMGVIVFGGFRVGDVIFSILSLTAGDTFQTLFFVLVATLAFLCIHLTRKKEVRG